MSTVDSLRARFAKEEHDRHVANQAALKGAIRAFPKPNDSSATTVPSATVHSPKDNASAAATKIWHTKSAATSPNPPRPPVKPLGLSTASFGAVRAHQKSQDSLLSHKDTATSPRAGSPSNAAAIFAAAQHKAHIPNSHSVKSIRPQTQLRRVSAGHDGENEVDTERLPEPGTVRDVKKWLQALDSTSTEGVHVEHEQGSRRPSDQLSAAQSTYHPSTSLSTREPSNVEEPRIATPVRSPPILSPRPVRAISAASSIEAATRREASISSARQARKSISHRPSNEIQPPRKRPAVPPKRDPSLRSKSITEDAPELEERPPLPSRKSTSASYSTAVAAQPTKPAAPPPRRSRPRTTTDPDTSLTITSPPTTTFPAPTHPTTAASPIEPTPSLPPRPSIDSTATTSTLHLRPQANRSTPSLPFRRVSPALSRDSLANAIVASSLASSRAPSPTKSPAPSLPPRPTATTTPRTQKRHFWSTAPDRAPSPTKGLRTTMRRSASSSSSDAAVARKGTRKFVLRKHPHKHREGSRKRWRDEITEPERRRYEGVWAANRGVLLDEGGSDGVHGLVVREVWGRSRLAGHVLEEVWGLVDSKGEGWLGRGEFVVGMWLVDQRLKGRKLPVRVGESVWGSVRAGGVRVKA